jgi:FkbM family methyltransferase
MRLLEQLRNNLPGEKPEFWRDPLRAVGRRLVLALQGAVEPAFEKRPFIARLAFDDLLMEVIPGETIGRAIATAGVYEWAPTEMVRRYLKEGDVFVDVGANIGYYSLIAARRVGGSGRVVAFEPYAPVRERLMRNITLNQPLRVEVREEAVSNASGRGFLSPPQSGDNDGTAGLVYEEAGAIEIRRERLDAALAETPPDFVKVDVEGHEAAVFEGMSGLLERDVAPSLMFESFRIDADAAILENFGYSVFAPTLRRGSLAFEQISPQLRYYRAWEAPNFLAVKSSRGHAFVRELLRD